jgi:hypothetical protein
MPEKIDFYSRAHLVVAAVRILSHLNAVPPSIADVCQHVRLASEEGHMLTRKLHDMGAIEIVEGGFGNKIFLRDHTRLESIPRGDIGPSMEDELRRFHDARAGMASKVAAIQAEQARKKKDLFAELEKKLKTERNDRTA